MPLKKSEFLFAKIIKTSTKRNKTILISRSVNVSVEQNNQN